MLFSFMSSARYFDVIGKPDTGKEAGRQHAIGIGELRTQHHAAGAGIKAIVEGLDVAFVREGRFIRELKFDGYAYRRRW